ncbi:P-loop containing nucleoside triphosphate hydrolase protein [Choiromyces venosus 120613-1]|uniref:P-loop containing nucleoside triphosphate hydrolase protein n=1 Tax=Choiromyces venosus 120613-1 TaxID=1336337 RepID=A0A3N4JIP6_9PEZI|nr:P-loop containing nucleoside triphosphate hydrolase protein [Choiromyces venosus 120613-1]
MPPPPLLIAISGPSNSGKTTLTRHLQNIFTPPPPPSSPTITIPPRLHQDDFFHTDSQIPIAPSCGLQDWDCPGAIDWTRFVAVLRELKQTGRVPEGVQSFEDLVRPDDGGVVDALVGGCKERVWRELGGGGGLALVEGFLMFVEERVMRVLDVKIFLRGRGEALRKRREGRNVYATVEGYWQDPPGYWDQIVWPNYLKAHKHLFVNGDVEGELDGEVISSLGIHSPGIDWSISEILPWAVDLIIAEMKKRKQQE